MGKNNFLALIFGLIGFVSVVRAIGIPIKIVRPRDVNKYDLSIKSAMMGRIVNGEQAVKNQFPHQVYVKGFVANTVSVCGGSLISEEHVLTAAHCVYGFDSFEVGLGTTELNNAPVKMTPTKITYHAEFDPDSLVNDIAIIQLSNKVYFSDSIKSVKLPSLSQSNEQFVNYQAAIAGFGRIYDGSPVSSTLNYVNVRVISNVECRSTFGKAITDKILCVKGWDSPYKNACQGDSGGGITLTYVKEPVVIGIVSFVSVRGCAFGDPSGFTRVTSYLDWISKNTGIKIES